MLQKAENSESLFDKKRPSRFLRKNPYNYTFKVKAAHKEF